jgi:hypothetical protein
MEKIVTYYIVGRKSCALYVRKGDREEMVVFESRWNGLEGCIYTTSDPEMQNAIETCDDYKRGRIKVKTVIRPQSEPDVKAMLRGDVKEYEKVKTVQQAANILIEEYGQSECDCQNKAAVLATARKVGVGFPNLK